MVDVIQLSDDCKSADESKETQLLKLVKEGGKPFVKKCDGYAVKVSEDKEITYEDWDKNENVLKVPKDSYVIVDEGGHSCKIVTAEDFEAKNEFVKDTPKRKKSQFEQYVDDQD